MSPASIRSLATLHGGAKRRQKPTCRRRCRSAGKIGEAASLGQVEGQGLLAQHVQPRIERRLRRARGAAGSARRSAPPPGRDGPAPSAGLWYRHAAGQERAGQVQRVGRGLDQRHHLDGVDVGQRRSVEPPHPAQPDDAEAQWSVRHRRASVPAPERWGPAHTRSDRPPTRAVPRRPEPYRALPSRAEPSRKASRGVPLRISQPRSARSCPGGDGRPPLISVAHEEEGA